jgi:hypothetical protein
MSEKIQINIPEEFKLIDQYMQSKRVKIQFNLLTNLNI